MGRDVNNHPLQTAFASYEGEQAYVGALRALVEAGEFDAADAQLAGDLASLETELAQACLALPADRVTITGWPELYEAVEILEGDPVTGLAIGLINDPDTAFDKAGLHRPDLTCGVYCDGEFSWSEATDAELIAEIASGEPAWAGYEEDVEVFITVEGLEYVNSALLSHKHRHFFRDESCDVAPFGYVEFVLASWFRALRFHQAVAAQYAEHGLPGGARVISGLVDMRPDVTAVHGRQGAAPAVAAVPPADLAVATPVSLAPTEPEYAQEQSVTEEAETEESAIEQAETEQDAMETASLMSLSTEPRGGPIEEEVTVYDIRRRVAQVAAESEDRQQPEKRGFFARLLRRA